MDVARTGRSSLGNAKGRLCEPITLQICWMGAPGSGRVEVPGGAVLGMPGAVSVNALESLAWRLRGFSMNSVSLHAAAAGGDEMRPRLRGHGKECRKRVGSCGNAGLGAWMSTEAPWQPVPVCGAWIPWQLWDQSLQPCPPAPRGCQQHGQFVHNHGH